MNHDELIAKARAHAKVFELGGAFPVRIAELPKTRVIEAVVIYFGSNDRSDVIEITLDRESGDCMVRLTRHPRVPTFECPVR